MHPPFDPYHKWLGIPAAEQPANYYRLLGLGLFEADADVISHAADRQMRHVRSFQNGPHAQQSQELMNELAAAKVCLLTPEKKAAYDAQLRQQAAGASPSATQPTMQPPSAPPSLVVVGGAPPVQSMPPRPSKKGPRRVRPWKAVLGTFCVIVLAMVLTVKYWPEDSPADPPGKGPVAKKKTPAKGPPAKMPLPADIAKHLREGDVDLPNLPGAVELISGVDPAVHSDPEKNTPWRKEGGVLISPVEEKYITLAIPATVPDEYMVALLVERVAGRHDSLAIIVPVGGRQCVITLDGSGGKASGLDLIDKVRYDKNPSTYRGEVFPAGQSTAVICLVRTTGVKVVRGDGTTVIDWQGNPAQISRPHYWPKHDGLALGTKNTEYRIYQMVLAPLPPEEAPEEAKQTPEQKKTDEKKTAADPKQS